MRADNEAPAALATRSLCSPGASDQEATANDPLGRVQDMVAAAALEGADFGAEHDRSPTIPRELGEHPEDRRVVGDSGGRDPQAADSDHRRLTLGDLLSTDDRRRNLARLRPLEQLAELGELCFVGRHDQLPAALVRNAMIAAEPNDRLVAGAAQQRLEASGLVVDARMDDSAVATSLVSPERLLLLEHDDAQLRPPVGQRYGCCQSDDARAHDRRRRTLRIRS